MSDVWNSWEVKPPPVCTIKQIVNFKEINGLKEVLFDILKTLRNVDYLHKEAAILSRFLYKNRRLFRHEKSLQSLVKINQCLKRYLKLNFCEVVNTLKQSIPGKIPNGVTHAYLPTRQMLKWVLLRLQAFAQIFVRVTNLSMETGSLFYQKMHLGWSLNVTLLTFSTTARILSCSKFLVAKSIEWYSSLYKYLPCLEQTREFHPEYKPPADLKKWLGDVDVSPLKRSTSIDKVLQMIDLVRGDEDEGGDDGEVLILKETLLNSLFKGRISEADSDVEEVEVVESEKQNKGVKRSLVIEDVGVPVDEEGEIVEIPTKKSKKKMKKLAKLHRKGLGDRI